jgi:hypothetical protein
MEIVETRRTVITRLKAPCEPWFHLIEGVSSRWYTEDARLPQALETVKTPQVINQKNAQLPHQRFVTGRVGSSVQEYSPDL